MTYILKNVALASIQIQKVAIYDSYRKIINLISNKSFRYYYNLKSMFFFGAFLYSYCFIIFLICFIYKTNNR